MANSFTTILYNFSHFLSDAIFRFIIDFFVIIIFIGLSIYYCRRGTDKNNGNDYKWITNEWKLLRLLQKDVESVSKPDSDSEIDKEVYNFWQTEEPNQGMTARLKPTEEDWYKKSTNLIKMAEHLSLNPEDTDKTSKSKSGANIRGFKKEINDLLEEKKENASDIYKTLENLKSKIRKLQVRPIDDVHKEGQDLISRLLDDVKEVDKLIPNAQREDERVKNYSNLPADVRAEIQKFKMHLALIRAFLTDLKRFGLKTQTEKAWLGEANEIVSDKETIKTLIQKTRNPKGMSLSSIATWRAVKRLRDEMKRINTGFDEFLERKERFGFQFIRSFIRRETEPSKSDPGTPQRQESKLKTSDDGFHVESYVNKLKNKYELELKDSEKEILRDLCNKFNEVHGKFEKAKSKEGITSSTEERSKQMKKLTENTEYYFKKYKENSTGLGCISKRWRNPEKTLCKKFQQIDGSLDILAKTTEAYSFEIKEEMRAVGLDDDIQAVASQLMKSGEDAKHIVCIVGMRGIGKTTLAKNIYEHSDIKNHFPARDWVTLTDQKADKYGAIFKNLAEQASENKRWLVVLDNFTAKDENEWKTIEEAFPAWTDGSRILLTTRDRCVAKKVDQSIELRHLRLRTKEESWRLFTQMVDDFGSDTNDVKKLAEEIVGRCVGLPLQILQFGCLMSGKDVKDTKLSEWLKRINPPQKPWLEHIQGVEIKDWPNNRRNFFFFLQSLSWRL